ncbi:Dehydroquinate synthase-like protein [Podospora australis]|uniref:Dehydroquinate synthase-like protein n=1 Tax=Podospora australis TaxID=1536484 RepID=A0AAN7AF85_9PEZI|nr:Dehydroquinate synthase-like protein [Podospora australis]
MPLEGEEYFQALPDGPHVSIGLPFDKACAHHATHTFHAKRIYIIVSSSISKTGAFTPLKAALGDDNIAGVRYGIRQHVPWPDVLEVAADLRRLDADLIVTLGAGSLTDGAKVAAHAAANLEDFTLDALAELQAVPGKPPAKEWEKTSIPTINIPTSLSGGEYNAPGGATDLRRHKKGSFPTRGSQLVILDPELTIPTPREVWLSSGMRAVDHCVEGLCSVAFRPGSSEENGIDRKKVEGYLIKGLQLLLPNLLITNRDPKNLGARKQSMLGVIEAFRGLTKVPMGASHGIGHQLGPLGVGHGETSCVILPSVLEWNRRHGDDWVVARQGIVQEAFWRDATVRDALEKRGLNDAKHTARAGDLVAAFVAELGLPGSLKEVGIGRDRLEGLAKNSMGDRCIPTNPVGVDERQVLEILEMALGDYS